MSESNFPHTGQERNGPAFRLLAGGADLVHIVALFLLAAGSVHFEPLDLKAGTKLENLFPLLLIAFLIGRKRTDWRSLSNFAPGLYLLVSGLVIGTLSSFSIEALEELGRFLMRIGTGVLLSYWIWNRLVDGKQGWSVVWLVGLVFLQVRTPWGSLSEATFEGPFNHRNTQSAFYILSLPLILLALHQMWSGKPPKLPGWVKVSFLCATGTVLLSELLFMSLSKSRSGVIGVVATVVLGIVFVSRKRNVSHGKLALGIVGLAFVLLLLGLSLAPRFKNLGRELVDPFYLSRSGIWAAATHGWEQPERWVTGIGMGDGYNQVVRESAIGNLNHRYRRGHHPHSMYLQWLYWGGVASLLGWGLVLLPIWRSSRGEDAGWEIQILGACLLGFAALELFECAFRHPRIAIMFWLDLCLLACYATACLKGGEEGDS